MELGSADTDCSTGRGDECTGGGDEDRPLVAVHDTETLLTQFRVKGGASLCEGLPQLRAVEARGLALGTFARQVRKSLGPAAASFGACRLDGFPVIGLVSAGDGFEAGEIVPAIENPQAHRIDFGDGDVKMRPPALNVSDNEARPIPTDPELGIDRPEEVRQLRRRHIALGRHGKMTYAVSAAFRRRERMGIVKRLPIPRQNVNALVLGHFVQEVARKVSNAAVATNARRLNDHVSNSWRRNRTASTSARIRESSSSRPAIRPELASLTS